MNDSVELQTTCSCRKSGFKRDLYYYIHESIEQEYSKVGDCLINCDALAPQDCWLIPPCSQPASQQHLPQNRLAKSQPLMEWNSSRVESNFTQQVKRRSFSRGGRDWATKEDVSLLNTGRETCLVLPWMWPMQSIYIYVYKRCHTRSGSRRKFILAISDTAIEYQNKYLYLMSLQLLRYYYHPLFARVWMAGKKIRFHC